ncbi:MAG: M23 family metallopeptidase [Gemmatimonadaceae bacterium]
MTAARELRLTRLLLTQLCVGAVFTAAGRPAPAQQVGVAPLEVAIPHAPRPVRALGRLHLVYEIHLTNFGARPVRLEALDVLDSAGHAITALSGVPLAQRVTVVGQPPVRSATGPLIAAGARAVAYMWITLSAEAQAPVALRHRLTLSGEDAQHDTLTLRLVHPDTAAVPEMAAPVRGGPWVAIRAPSNTSGHRLSLVATEGTVRVPQRFAVDWARLGEDGRLFRGDSSTNATWYGYRDTVYAAAAGRVVIARDGAPDNTPLAPPSVAVVDARQATGNVVVIETGDGQFTSYAHLAPGSLSVKAGDRVAQGASIGLIGNSGNSLGPHLHFQVSDAAEVLHGEGVPFVLDEFELVGRVQGIGPLLAGSPWTASADRPARRVRAEIPLENMVVRFGPDSID